MNGKAIVITAIMSLYFTVALPSFAQTSQSTKGKASPVVVDSVKAAKVDKKLNKIQARADAKIEKIQAKADARMGKVQAKADSGKADAKIEKIQAKADARMGKVQAKADSAKAKKELKGQNEPKGLMGMKEKAKAMTGRMAPADSIAAAVKPK